MTLDLFNAALELQANDRLGAPSVFLLRLSFPFGVLPGVSHLLY